jgi:hypothetical protein
MNTRQQGDIGELSAGLWFAGRGAVVAYPFGASRDWDMVVDWNDHLYRVQVKTSTCFRNGRWSVAICTRGGNQSWDGVTKLFDPERVDFLFVHVGDGRRWLIPSRSVGGGRAIMLGGEKYAMYEIERGVEIARRTAVDQAA